MNQRGWLSLKVVGITAIVVLAHLASTCEAQSDSTGIYLDRGYYYGTVYDPRYSNPQNYGQSSYPTAPYSGYSSRSSYPSYGAYGGGGYGYGPVGSDNTQMGPYTTAINGPLGNNYGLYRQRYYSSYGPMTYYGSYGYRGFDR